ncbi:MAG: energy transducer TonB, partial [Candidatus Neomarinimicrobiota bacterium]
LFLACMAGDTQIPKPKFVKYDSPPEPIGGFKTIQENLIYPEKAKQAGIEGKAVIQAQVGKDGVVKQSVVLQSSGNAELDAAVLEAINKTKFKPAFRKEKPVSVYISIPVIFTLQEKTEMQGKSDDKKNAVAVENEQKIEFVPYDEAPEPVGGFKAIQENLVYPEKAKQAGIEGTTVIQARVDEKGDIEKAVVLQSSGNDELDAAAIEALKKTKFKPAVFDKKPVGVYILIPVMFNLGAKNEEQDKSEDSGKTDDNAKPDSLPFDTSPEPVGGFAALQRNIVYPAIAQEGGVEGMVIVQASIDEKGNVTKCTVARGLPNTGLDEAAINAVKKTHFKPATLKGKPVEVTISIPINFKNAR